MNRSLSNASFAVGAGLGNSDLADDVGWRMVGGVRGLRGRMAASAISLPVGTYPISGASRHFMTQVFSPIAQRLSSSDSAASLVSRALGRPGSGGCARTIVLTPGTCRGRSRYRRLRSAVGNKGDLDAGDRRRNETRSSLGRRAAIGRHRVLYRPQAGG